MASERADDREDVSLDGSYKTSPENGDQGRFYYMGGPENLHSRPTPRRSKRHVPDTEKDNKYWEKRKRNNDAARRSRETKRRMDMDIRGRVLVLEEELSLVRKELTVIKVKFGLPLDQRFLTTDGRGDLVPSALGGIALNPLPPLPPMSPPMPSEMSPGLSQGMAPDAMQSTNNYSMAPTQGNGPTDSSSMGQVGRAPSTGSRHQGAPHINTQMDHLGPASQTSPSDNMPVKKRRRGRREWEDSDDQGSDAAEGSGGPGDAYYGRMLSGSPYPGMLWPSSGNPPPPASNSGQFPFPGQMAPMMGAAAAYQAIVDEQQRLPSINAFSNVPVKSEQDRQQQQQQQQHANHQHQPQQVQQPQQHSQPPHSQPHTNGNRSEGATPDNFEYLDTANQSQPLPRYYVPYSESEGTGAPRQGAAPSISPADLSMANKARHQNLELPGGDVSDPPSRPNHQHQQIGIVQPMQGSHQQQQQPQQLQQSQQPQQQSQHQHSPAEQQQEQHQQRATLSSDEDEHQGRLMTENSDIRNRLQLLTAEVAKMKDYVLKDNSPHPTANGDEQ